VVVLDTLRKAAFDRAFDWLPGRRFERAYSTANWTVPAHASLLGGRYASELGVHAGNTRFDPEERSLAERLAAAGYTTRAYSANPNVSGQFDFDRGFEEFAAPVRLRGLSADGVVDWGAFSARTETSGLRRYAAALRTCLRPEYDTLASLRTGLAVWRDDGPVVEVNGTAEATDYVAGTDFGDREFLLVNVMEAHEPYRPPERYRSVDPPPLLGAVGDLFTDGVETGRVRRSYGDCVRYLADQYRDLFGRLREQFDYVITCADHGELLGEGGAWGHEHGVAPDLVHVPLVVSGPGCDGRSRAVTSLLDVHATVLDAAGVDAPARGRSLLATSAAADATEGRSRAVLTEYLGLTPWSRERLAESELSSATTRRYDATLRGVATAEGYGRETVDGFVADDADADDLLARLDARVETLDERAVRTETELPEAVRDRLERLGYA
jgi:arylsulfatase